MLDYQGSGQSVMEMSHRSKVYDNIIKEAEADLRELMNIPDNYKVLFLQGGASQFFAEVPMNLMKNKKAAYIITGQWAKKAYKEAQIYGEAVAVASSEDKTFSYIPDCSDLDIPEDADYVYICENNTIYGTKFKTLPNTKGHLLVSDVSSCFLSEPIDVTKYGVVYGGVQKNIGPAGVVIAIIREDLITDDVLPGTPTMLKWKTQADADSLYNTPPCYNIYICGIFVAVGNIAYLFAFHPVRPCRGAPRGLRKAAYVAHKPFVFALLVGVLPPLILPPLGKIALCNGYVRAVDGKYMVNAAVKERAVVADQNEALLPVQILRHLRAPLRVKMVCRLVYKQEAVAP